MQMPMIPARFTRRLWYFVKEAHVGVIPGTTEYLAEFSSDKAWGDEGYLAEKGLISIPADERRRLRLLRGR